MALNFSEQEIEQGLADRGADPDEDFYTNLEEFAFRSNPRVATSGMVPALQYVGTKLYLSFDALPSWVPSVYKVEASVDMVNWVDANWTYLTREADTIIDDNVTRRTYKSLLQFDAKKAVFFRVSLVSDEADQDEDFLNDQWEIYYGLNSATGDMNNNGALDFHEMWDSDSLTNAEEARYGTNPYSGDSDNDGISDSMEILFGLNSLVPDGHLDYDGDGIDNASEIASSAPFDPMIDNRDGIFLNLRKFTKVGAAPETEGPWQRYSLKGRNIDSLPYTTVTDAVPAGTVVRYEYYLTSENVDQTRITVREVRHNSAVTQTLGFSVRDVKLWANSEIFSVPSTGYSTDRFYLWQFRVRPIDPFFSSFDYFGFDNAERFFIHQRLVRPVLSLASSGGAKSFQWDVPTNMYSLVETENGVVLSQPQSGVIWTANANGVTSQSDKAVFDSTDDLLDFAIYPPSTYTVTIHLVTWRKSPTEVKALSYDLTREGVQQFLDEVYKNQANVTIQLNPLRYHDITFDVGDATNSFPKHTKIKNGPNGCLDVFGGDLASPEEAILHSLKDNAADLNIYITPAPLVVHVLSESSHPDVEDLYLCLTPNGYCSTAKEAVFIAQPHVPSYTTDPELALSLIAHEIGHSSINGGTGLKHPRSWSAKHGRYLCKEDGFPLKFVRDDIRRIMWAYTMQDNPLLIKQEWDILNNRLPTPNSSE